MNVTLPYGKTQVDVKIPDGATVAHPRELPRVNDVDAEIRRAMAAPIGSPPLRDVAAGKRDAVVVINDITRPAPSREMLTAILEELRLVRFHLCRKRGCGRSARRLPAERRA